MPHWNEQDVLLYPDRSSSTVAVHSIMMELIVAACHREYTVTNLDVKGAFTLTEMRDSCVRKCKGALEKLIFKFIFD